MPANNGALSALLNVFKSVPQDALSKAADDLRDSVDVDPRYTADLREALNSTAGIENGRPVKMSGSENLAETYSALAANQTNLMRIYEKVAEQLESERVARKADRKLMLTAISALAARNGMYDVSKALKDAADDEESDQTDKRKETAYDAAEKAAMAGHPATASVADIITGMHAHVMGLSKSSMQSGIATPPVFTDIAKANTNDFGISDAEIEFARTPEEATRLLSERQRRRYRFMHGMA